mmetsp:Transcript_6498/g.15432  ORF Transcript_6498/g.15432 Transcript_6498/m.15432 type:complete len:479 (-) Transcript_6498:33-1469(-)
MQDHALNHAPEAPAGNLINEEHSRYIFAVAAMFGIHVVTLCHQICVKATTTALGNACFAELFERTFPRLSYTECLQNSCYTYRIPPEGSAYSPPTGTLTRGQLDVTYFLDDFCPQLFSQVRGLCGISNDQYIWSICRPDVEFVEFCASSRSGEFFLFSHDGRYLLKTAKRFEAEALLRMLPDMVERFESCPESLLGRYLGLYRVYGDEINFDVLFFVMQSVTQHSLPIHSTYDLKGCLGKHRRARPGESVKKDLDWLEDFGDMGLCMADADHLLATHADDLALLQKHTITDYSVLLQIHDRQARGGGTDAATLVRSCSLIAEGPTRLGTLRDIRESNWSSQLSAAGDTASLSPVQSPSVGILRGKEPSLPSPTQSASVGSVDGEGCVEPRWRPSCGIPSADGRYLYTLSLIDLLVPFNWRGKVETGYYELVSCGHGYMYSKQAPCVYAERQIELFERMCGRCGEDSCARSDSSSDISE